MPERKRSCIFSCFAQMFTPIERTVADKKALVFRMASKPQHLIRMMLQTLLRIVLVVMIKAELRRVH
jgi:hypothetical protein